MEYDQMVSICEQFGIPYVRPFFSSETETKPETLSELLEFVHNKKGVEGCVVRFSDGLMFKVKTNWYHDLNRGLHTLTKTKNDNERYIWSIILDSSYDDMKAMIKKKSSLRVAVILYSGFRLP